SSLAAGDLHCPAGGVKYLSADGEHYVCNGIDGAQGALGPQGIPGVAGQQGLTGIAGRDGLDVAGLTLAASDPHCPTGGVKYTSIDGDQYVCNGIDGVQGA